LLTQGFDQHFKLVHGEHLFQIGRSRMKIDFARIFPRDEIQRFRDEFKLAFNRFARAAQWCAMP
jgi:hypothetical protein